VSQILKVGEEEKQIGQILTGYVPRTKHAVFGVWMGSRRVEGKALFRDLERNGHYITIPSVISLRRRLPLSNDYETVSVTGDVWGLWTPRESGQIYLLSSSSKPVIEINVNLSPPGGDGAAEGA